jgi:hypothetical protein
MATTYETAGTALYRVVSGVENPVPLITSIDPIGQARSLIDVTTLSSNAREYRLALKDGQEINCEGFYDPGDLQQAGLKSDLDNGTRRDFVVRLTDDSPAQQVSFTALVMNWSLGVPLDNVYPLRFTLKPTGDLTLADSTT